MSQLVLIVDDEPGIQTTLSAILEDQGYRTVCTDSGSEALDLFQAQSPDLVFLDIWLADHDGLETLRALRKHDPSAAVIMMSGHGTAATAVKTIKMGAFDYLEKPLSYERTIEAAEGALAARESPHVGVLELEPETEPNGGDLSSRLEPPPPLPLLVTSEEPQRTLARSKVLYGVGLHSGNRTGMALLPLPPDSGIHLMTLPAGTLIPAHVRAVAETAYATTVSGGGDHIRTVEHLLSALHAYGVTNLLIKVHGEIPVLDGSALEFCKTLEEVGLVEQDAPRREIVVDRRFEVSGSEGKAEKILSIEPYDGFQISYQLSYPQPVGEQFYEFELDGPGSYKAEIAPARTFGFMRDVQMMNELGLGSGGRLDNFILVGEDEVINTDLRFQDEFVRHKILDIIGDLYLLGYPLRGRVQARFTGHRDNIAILREILEAL